MTGKTTSPVRVPDAQDQDLYQQNVSAVLADAPPFSDAVRMYAHYKPYPQESWLQFKARIDLSFAGAAAANDVTLPVWDPNRFCGIQADEPADQPAMDNALARAFGTAKQFARSGWDNPVAEAVLLKLAQLAGACGLLPHAIDPNTTEFAWAPARCVFAAGGPKLHARLCDVLMAEPGFPWTADEDAQVWDASVAQAHAAQGWPTTVAVIRWTALSRLPKADDDVPLPAWMLWRAWVHVLTVLRFDQTDGQLRMVHDGKCVTVKLEQTTNLLSHQKRALPTVLAGLGCVSDVQKRAALFVLGRLTVGDLLPAAPYSDLPYTVIAGRWSKLSPDRSVEGWSECRMKVANAWIAGNGAIQSDIPDEEAVLHYAWPVFPMDRERVEDLDRFKTGVPAVYQPAWPSDLLEAVFPNITDCGIVDADARRALIDVVLVADMLRGECPCLNGEYPLFTVLPDRPTLEDSVNQGKTTFCVQYAKASVPGLSRAMTFRDSSSAPDQRAIADELRRMGTICLDEFTIPKSNTAVLSRANMASLLTGGAVPMGKVMGNDNAEVTLKHPLFVSAKALDLTEDLLTRGVFVFLRALTPAERARPGVWDALKTAKLSILLRLGALAMIDKHGLAAKLNAMQHSTDGWRFGAHRSLAMLLYQVRTGAPADVAAQAVAAALVENKMRVQDHTRMADDQGVIMSQRESRDMRITLEQVFTEVTGAEAQMMEGYIRSKAGLPRMTPRIGMKGLMQARMAVDGRQDQPISTGFNQLTNLGVAVGERMVSNLLGAEIRRRIPECSAWRLPGIAGASGWFLYRHRSRSDGQTQVSLVCLPEHAAHAALTGDLDGDSTEG